MDSKPKVSAASARGTDYNLTYLQSIISNPHSLMNRSKSIADTKAGLSSSAKPAKGVKGPNDKQKKPKKMKMSSFLPCEFDNDLDEALRKDEELQ